ncbi:hypothetical protein FSARC_12332, partial [Fusarium sarcochroum]
MNQDHLSSLKQRIGSNSSDFISATLQEAFIRLGLDRLEYQSKTDDQASEIVHISSLDGSQVLIGCDNVTADDITKVQHHERTYQCGAMNDQQPPTLNTDTVGWNTYSKSYTQQTQGPRNAETALPADLGESLSSTFLLCVGTPTVQDIAKCELLGIPVNLALIHPAPYFVKSKTKTPENCPFLLFRLVVAESSPKKRVDGGTIYALDRALRRSAGRQTPVHELVAQVDGTKASPHYNGIDITTGYCFACSN